MDSFTTGTRAGAGTFRCAACDYVITLSPGDLLPRCSGCGADSFVRASIFSGHTTAVDLPAVIDSDPTAWIDEVRSAVDGPGQYLAFADGNEIRVFALSREWTRIGRSLAADIRFDDPTVSRRHALVVRRPDAVRVLDDRSLNGVFVNGERVEWGSLSDGDEVVVGRHRMRFIDVPPVSGMRDAPDPGAALAS